MTSSSSPFVGEAIITSCPRPERVAFVLFDELQLLDLAGPADVFRTATLLGAEPR